MTLTDKVLEQIMEKFGDGRTFLIPEVDVCDDRGKRNCRGTIMRNLARKGIIERLGTVGRSKFKQPITQWRVRGVSDEPVQVSLYYENAMKAWPHLMRLSCNEHSAITIHHGARY